MTFKNKEEFQSTALQLLKNNHFIGIIVADTGASKSKVAIDAIKEGDFKNVLITSPRTNLKENWREELSKWFPITILDTDYYQYITIENIQTCYKWVKAKIKEFDLIIYDEIHTCGEEYFRLIRIARELSIPVIGLTATPNKKDDWKKEVLYKAVPILIEYHSAESDGLVNKCKYWIYEYELTDNYKVLTGTKTKKWYVGEAKQYTYLSDQYEKAKKLMFDQGATDYFNQSLEWMKAKNDGNFEVTKEQKEAGTKFFFAVRKRKEFLWNLESSKQIALALKKKILLKMNLVNVTEYFNDEEIGKYPISKLNNKVLLFSELTSQAEKLSPYSIHSNNGTSAKEIESNNKRLLEQFNNGTIRELSSCLSLTLGLNLIGCNWEIHESYSSSLVNSKQKAGRGHRLDINDVCNIIIIKPLNTQAVEWFNSAWGWIKDYTVIHSPDELKI